MKEKPQYWPQADMEEITQQWWETVMQGTSLYDQLFSPQLDDAQDFTIRAIVYIILSQDRDTVSWFMDSSMQADRVLVIRDLIHDKTKEKRVQGQKELAVLIEDYTKEVLEP